MFFWFVLAGLSSGIFAGMGMGGGTFLIPILTLLLGVSQPHAQLVNLIVFALSSVVVLIINQKNGLLKTNNVWWIVIPACLVSAMGSILALSLQARTLKYVFAGFLCAVGIAQIIVLILQSKNAKQDGK